jgi:hypothetical protein
MFKKDFLSIAFPVGGVTRRTSLQSQNPYTCYDALNVFPDGVHLERERGGSRAGLIKDFAGPGGSVNLIGELSYLDDDGILKSRLLIGGVGGTLKTIDDEGEETLPTGELLNTDFTLTGDAHLGLYFIARGQEPDEDILFYDPKLDTVAVASDDSRTKGTWPQKCRICMQWRDRLVLSQGEDAHEIYFSRQGDPFDWDYTATDVQRPIRISATKGGRIGQPVRALIPHSDNCLLICTNTEWYVMRGDVTSGGTVSLITSVLGIMGRRSWCYSPDSWLWALTNDGLYAMPPGQCGGPLRSVSREKLPQELVNYNPSDWVVSMVYCHRMRGVFCFMYENKRGSGTVDPPFCGVQSQGSDPPEGAQITVTHFFTDIRNTQSNDTTNVFAASFWPLSLASQVEPTYAFNSKLLGFTLDDDDNKILATEPAAYMGTHNGNLYHFERKKGSKTIPGVPVPLDLENDEDAGSFTSYVMFGPFSLGKGGNIGLLETLRAILSYDSNPVEYEIYAGDDAETILHQTAVFTGTWTRQGQGYLEHLRIRGSYFYILVRSTNDKAWSVEALEATRQHRTGRKRVHYDVI